MAYTPEGSLLPDCGNSLDAVIHDIQVVRLVRTSTGVTHIVAPRSCRSSQSASVYMVQIATSPPLSYVLLFIIVTGISNTIFTA